MEKTQKNFWQKTKRFLSPIAENKAITIFNVVYFIAETSFWVLFIFFLKDIVYAFELSDKSLFFSLLKEYILYFFCLTVLLLSLYTGWAYWYNRYRSTIEKKYLKNYVKLDSNKLEAIGTGKAISIISGWINMWGGLLDRTVMQVVQMLISIVLWIYFLFQVDAKLMILFVFLLLVGQMLWYLVNVKIVDIRKKRIELSNDWSRWMVKIIMSKMEILQSQKIGTEIDRLHENHEKQIYYNKKMAVFLVPFFFIGNGIVMILLCGSFFYFSQLYFDGNLSLSIIAALSGAIMMMQKEFMNMLDFVKNFWKEFALVQKLWDFFDTTPEMEWYDTGGEFQIWAWNIGLKNINYWYEDNNLMFENFDLEIKWWKVTALVWPSGGGKSTLVKLVAWYIRANTGEVVIDDQTLADVSLKSYYKHIGYLTQEPSVFDGTIRENLSYALKAEVEEKTLNEALKNAGCDFVFEFEKWIDTEIWEKGIRLSGWQRQRLAIAKIFLKDPHIIILDEPTSALDSFSEQKIAEAMERLFKGRTVIVIAHRLQTVKHADEIIYIESGKIVERGNHAELVKQNGLYKQMLDLQSGF